MVTTITPINKAEFFQKDTNIFKVRDALEDLYDKIDILNERLKALEAKL
jgi:hypothetical protein